MLNILSVATVVLNALGFVFSCVFLWINVFRNLADIDRRNQSILKITWCSMIISVVCAFLNALLSSTDDVEHAIAQSAKLFSFIAGTWLVVLAGCGIIMLISVASKTYFKAGNAKTIRRLFKVALPGALTAIVLAWLFS